MRFKNGLVGRAWDMTHRIQEISVVALRDIINAAAVEGGPPVGAEAAVRVFVDIVKRTLVQVAPLRRSEAFT
eukprot:8341511-Prorocentrum_lima.AAC.1